MSKMALQVGVEPTNYSLYYDCSYIARITNNLLSASIQPSGAKQIGGSRTHIYLPYCFQLIRPSSQSSSRG